VTGDLDTDRARRSVSHPRGTLSVVDRPGQDTPLVAMHGFPDDSRIYDRLMPHLAPNRTVAFDWLGYGRSDRRERRHFDSGDRQLDLITVLDNLQLDHVVLIAHDASGPEAVELAITQPARVRGLVLLNTYYGRSPSLHLPEMIGLFADPELRALADAMVDDEAQRLWLVAHTARRFGRDPGDPADVGTASVLPQFFGGPDGPDALAEIRAWTGDLDNALDVQDRRIASSELAALDVPVTLIFGSDDRYLNPDLARDLASLFRQAEVHLIDRASHWPQWDQPEVVAGLIHGVLPR
jgi:pimeloyl-ACP methyl ester carboxylesterase